MFWTYILRCADGSHYTGHTDDIDRRLAQHRHGTFAGYTRERLPVEVVYSAWFHDRDQAFAFEQRVKGWSRAKKEALMRSDWRALQVAAMPPGERVARTGSNAEPSLDCARDERVESAESNTCSPSASSPTARSSRAQSRDGGNEAPPSPHGDTH